MAEVKLQSYKTLQQNGEYGNACIAILAGTLVAAAASDISLLGQIPGGSTIVRVTAAVDDMGGAQTMDIGYRYLKPGEGVDDPNGFFPGADTGTAAFAGVFTGPLEIADGCGVEIMAQNLGAVASGDISLMVEYVYHGQ
jgi:hypothetical protein